MRNVVCDPSPWPVVGDQIVFAGGNTEGLGIFGARLLAECNRVVKRGTNAGIG